jgi:phenylpyruvate tautomerase PptA (4-oxalocrotonate tautomerase family)
MPLAVVSVSEHRMQEEIVTKLITRVTQTIMDVINEEADAGDQITAEDCWVIVEGVPKKHWGVAGKPMTPWTT